MHVSSFMHSSSRHELAGRAGRQGAAKSSQTKIRGSIHYEDAVATISLATLSTTVLALVFQSMVP